MSQVTMLFLFPIAMYFYFFKERPNRPAYYKVFDDFQKQMDKDEKLSKSQKLQLFKEMLLKNDYKIVGQTDSTVTGEKRIFSMSLFMVGVGAYFMGAVVYLIYFFFIQKPHVVEFHL
ncbi:MAG: hypothetical protein LGB07_07750 [Sulfurovum sp.]|nr:hypothetical protein [Sulfurovum sp.]MCB4759032.1 hypothetical protein [Sulfurovum sp.]MCB4760132.1 hypothetical protein [Sulfurovum sp.]MCB4761885.1 hypothetical protein [Sulfurovum sp.]MCB4763917.1 hypothetical protein [Sulfurovum sp.]